MPRDFRWDDLQLFLTAYRTRSLTRAGEQLTLSQSTLSRRLTSFEEALGARLFDRTPEGLLPTELAERLLEPAERAEAATHDVARWSEGVDRGAEGEVKIAMTEGISFYFAAPELPRLLQRHPKLRVSFVLGTTSADLTRREADLAVRFYRPTSGDLVAKRLFVGEYAIYAAPALAERLGPGPHSLRGLPFIGWGETQSRQPEAKWEIERGVDVVARATSFPTRLALAEKGIGAIQLVRASAATYGRRLVELPTEPPNMATQMWLVTHRALREVPRIRAVWDWIEHIVTDPTAERSSGSE